MLEHSIKINSIFKSENTLKAVILCLGIPAIFLFCWAYLSKIFFPFPLSHVEGAILNIAKSLTEGQGIYKAKSFKHPPFSIAQYGPVYYYILAFGIKCFGIQLWFGRCVSFFAILASCFFLIVLIKDLNYGIWYGFLAILLFFLSPITLKYGPLLRPDSLALAFEVCGIYILLHYINCGRKYLFSIPIFILAGYTKQTMISLFLGIILFLFIIREYKKSICIFFLMLTGTLALFCIFECFCFERFYQSIILSNMCPLDLRNAFNLSTIFTSSPIVMLGIVITAAMLFQHEKQFTIFLGATSIILNFFALSKSGSDLNYFLESTIALSLVLVTYTFICIGKNINESEYSHPHINHTRVILFVLLLLFARDFISEIPHLKAAIIGEPFNEISRTRAESISLLEQIMPIRMLHIPPFSDIMI